MGLLYKFTVPHAPKGQPRAGRGKWGSFDPAAPVKEAFRLHIQSLGITVPNPDDLIKGVPLRVDVTSYIARPKGHYGTGKNVQLIKKSSDWFPLGTPDLDNYYKFVLDALTKFIWHDDSIVVEGMMKKRYTWPGTERTEVRIVSLEVMCENNEGPVWDGPPPKKKG